MRDQKTGGTSKSQAYEDKLEYLFSLRTVASKVGRPAGYLACQDADKAISITKVGG